MTFLNEAVDFELSKFVYAILISESPGGASSGESGSTPMETALKPGNLYFNIMFVTFGGIGVLRIHVTTQGIASSDCDSLFLLQLFVGFLTNGMADAKSYIDFIL